ncbi:DEKNAAC103414 [Brettanomyces naardenensis]|uniref:DEKNAAC103414 n=1 Tax=Brettanomyces naardenensis TaxID=13370 RepID=A0A448YNC3_BRENA|nr:DEKNAAC103414 [Brettanomyces naardenensis]
MGDVFDFDEDGLSSEFEKNARIDDAEQGTEAPFSAGSDTDGQGVQFFQKFQSGGVVSVGPIGQRLGTSYKVQIDEFYDAENLDSRSNSTNGPVTNEKPKSITRRKPKIQDFEQLKVLGKGSYGKVLLVKHRKTGKLYAQKQLQKASMIVNAKNYEQTLTERTILKKVTHPNIVKLYYALQDFDKVYLILEYLDGGELFHYLREERILSEKVACFYVAELILALRHLHINAGVIYRDLKPENCMLNSRGHLVLTDFGLSKASGECRSLFGTAEYMAPEVIRGEPYDSQCDWWSLGAVMYDMLTGSPPFTGNNHKRIMDKILKQKVQYPFYLSQDAKDLLRRLLNKNPAKRINCDTEFETVRKYRFFRYINWDDLEAQNDDKLPPPILPVITDPEEAENFDEEFTSMAITPPSSPIGESLFETIEQSRSTSTSSFIPIQRPDPENSNDLKKSVYFTGFSYTNETLLPR